MSRTRIPACGRLAILLLAAGTVIGQAQTQAPAQPPAPAAAAMPAGPIDTADIDTLLKQFNVPGVSIAVIKNFTIDWARGYGLADADAGTPVTAAATGASSAPCSRIASRATALSS